MLTLTLMPAGHAPGLYLIGFDLIVRTVSNTGTLARTYTYDAPTLGAATVTSPATITATAGPGRAAGGTASNTTLIFATQLVRSTGTSAIALVVTPSTITGTPVFDVYGSAMLAARA